MSDPRIDRDVSPAVQGENEALGSRIRSLLLGVTALIILVIAAGGYALYHRIGVLDGRLRTLQASMDDLKARAERVNVLVGGATTGIVALLREPAKVEQTLARIEKAASSKPPAPAPGPVVVLTPDDLAGLRSHFGLTAAGAAPQYKVGDKVPADALKSMPADVVEKIAPQLKGANYLIDQNGALVVTTGTDNVVVLIVAPA